MTITSKRRLRAPLALALVLGAAGCGADPVPPAPTEPACEPRSTTAPARLNIDSSAENFGAVQPCEATLSFSIARNTDLRALSFTIRLTDAEGQAVSQTPLWISFSGPAGGMYRGELAVTPVPGASCRSLEFSLEIERCSNNNDQVIECPEVGVQTSYVLRRLEASGSGVSVCYDD